MSERYRVSQRLAWYAGVFVGSVVVVFLAQVAAVRLSPLDDSDSPTGERSGVKPRTDHLTGCQYLESSRGGITARLDSDGKHVGCKRRTHPGAGNA